MEPLLVGLKGETKSKTAICWVPYLCETIGLFFLFTDIRRTTWEPSPYVDTYLVRWFIGRFGPSPHMFEHLLVSRPEFVGKKNKLD